MELELVLKKDLLQCGCELALEEATQGGDGQEESSRRSCLCIGVSFSI